MGGIFNSYL